MERSRDTYESESEKGERDEAHVRIAEAFSQLRQGPTGQAYWQLRTTLAKPEVSALLSLDERTAVEEARRVLEESPELRALKLLAEAAGKEEQQWT